MKRMGLDSPVTAEDKQKMKKVKQEEEEEEEKEGEQSKETGFTNLDENLLFEVLKHADARTLARAACVNKLSGTSKAQDSASLREVESCTRLPREIANGLGWMLPNAEIRWVLALGGLSARLPRVTLPHQSLIQACHPSGAPPCFLQAWILVTKESR
ncbi:hypothetical protein CUMW_045500 [Citrus unshiu]|nr:hypothetical protein CUMW_045500 [Citrus unshiu]